ncbi:MAG: hypothetical protein PHS73_01510 [Candidatus Peribacteraceae bacterium]|nr:hypothetical protein [Candidatus Peribacteraceae bacterium]
MPFERLSFFVIVKPNGKPHAEHMHAVAEQVRMSLTKEKLPIRDIVENRKTGLPHLLIDCPVQATDRLVEQYRQTILSCADVVGVVEMD